MLFCNSFVNGGSGKVVLGIEQPRVKSSAVAKKSCLNVICSNSASQQTTVLEEDWKSAKQATVLVLGGSGRVGGSTARALAATDLGLHIVLAGRNREKGEALAKELGEGTKFSQFDFEDTEQLKSILNEVDLVIHAAGPFQRRTKCTVLEAALATKTAYIDVCDDQDFSIITKKYHQQAIDAGVPALTTTGIYPGVSNLMAAELVRLNLEASSERKPSRIRYSYYTAGTGGAGPTILATSFLLLGEEVVVYSEGERLFLKAYSGVRDVDFGKGLGKKPTYLLNLPEVQSTHSVLGVPSVSARFGTDPAVWNWGMSAVAALAPEGFLKDKAKVDSFVKLVSPLVRALDGIVGEKVSIRVDLDCSDGKKAVGIYTHKALSVAVGVCIAAFARAVLEGSTKPGVWYPEEEGGIRVADRAKLLDRASKGTSNFIMNKPPWMIEQGPKEIGFGLYMQ